MGTNPIAVGIPREEGKEPVVLDMATAAYPCECHHAYPRHVAPAHHIAFARLKMQ